MSTPFTNDYTQAAEALRDFYLRSHRALDRLMAAQGASLARFKMMIFIKRNDKVRSADLAEAFGFAPRTITEAVDGLERDGLVERVMDSADRRVKYISLTELGKKVLCSSEPIRERFGDQLFEVLNKQEIGQLTQLLGRLNARLQELELAQAAQPDAQETAGEDEPAR